MYEIIDAAGITFIFSPLRDIDTSSLGIFLKTGARYEQKRVKGIAHFLEHLLFKGSKRYSYRRIKQDIEGRGGALNAFTSQEITAYYAHFLKKNLTSTLHILFDMVANPLLKEKDMRRERGVIFEEIKMYNDLPSSRVMSILDALLWQGHPLGIDVIGTHKTVESIQRSDLFSFKERQYGAKNMVISCSGNFSSQTIVHLLKGVSFPKGAGGRQEEKVPSPLRGVRIQAERKSLEQTYLCLGFRSISHKNPQRFIVELLHVILGANMSSRLFEEVREKRGLCYDISTDVRMHNDTGAFIVQLGLDKSKVECAAETIIGELAKIKNSLIGPRELGRAKDFFLGQVAMALERPQGRMFYGAKNYITLGKIHSFEEVKKAIAGVTAREVREMARQVFTFSNMAIACVGNMDEGIEETLIGIVRKRGGGS
jgi:predicted Zn-dependent peptidase